MLNYIENRLHYNCMGWFDCSFILSLGNCTAGWYCNGTSSISIQLICPTGHYCPEGTTIPVPCPAGTFAALENNAAESDCLNCTAGSYCQGN